MKYEVSDVHSSELEPFLKELLINICKPPGDYDQDVINHILYRHRAKSRVLWNEKAEIWEVWSIEGFGSVYPEIADEFCREAAEEWAGW